ncbi:MAG: PDZ domain-containing protein, partial [Burkholderiales bacterium]|nr:PDZ domain-containing protein [Burkholderiales bacterium]
IVILGVSRGSAAEAAGLKGAVISPGGEIAPKDIIIAIDDKPVTTVDKLMTRLDEYRVGDTIKITILRDGQVVEVSVTLQPGE